MAKAKTEQTAVEKTEPTVNAKPEALELPALQAEIEKLTAELEAARARIDELEAALEQAVFVAEDTETAPEPEPAYQVGGEAAEDAEVVAVKAKHGHAFWRSGYQIQPHFTFVKRADFEADAWARLLAEPNAVIREALPTEQA